MGVQGGRVLCGDAEREWQAVGKGGNDTEDKDEEHWRCQCQPPCSLPSSSHPWKAPGHPSPSGCLDVECNHHQKGKRSNRFTVRARLLDRFFPPAVAWRTKQLFAKISLTNQISTLLKGVRGKEGEGEKTK